MCTVHIAMCVINIILNGPLTLENNTININCAIKKSSDYSIHSEF